MTRTLGRTSAMSTFALIVAIMAGISTTASAQSRTLTGQQSLAREIFRELIEIDTTNRNGTTKAANAVAARLRDAGFGEEDIHVVGPTPEKMNVVARIRGKSLAGPILFIAHLDVVEALKKDWSEGLDPFKFTEKDGFFYGRGTVDVKQEAAGLVANLIRLKQEGFAPDRDIIVALTADEEGGDDNGVEWLLNNRRDLIEAEFCINTDAGGGQTEKGERLRYNVQTSEKAVANFQLAVTNPGGHSSQPVKDNAIYHLSKGLSRLADFDFPVKLNDTTREFFRRLSRFEKGPIAKDMAAMAGSPTDLEAAKRVAEASPFYNSIMRTTCVATMLDGGHARNALPQAATAHVNCRVLPEDSQQYVLETLKDVIADPNVTIRTIGDLKSSPASPLTPEVIGAIEKVAGEMWPGVPVLPVMDPWATDGLYLRREGIPVYAAPGMFFEIDPIRAHGKDERISTASFYEGVEFQYRFMKLITMKNK